MSVPAYLWLYDATGTLIRGDSEVLEREGSIEIQSFGHGLTVPYDGNTGRLTATRIHNAMNIEKEFHKSALIFIAQSQPINHYKKRLLDGIALIKPGQSKNFFKCCLSL